ncbi:MAG: Uncharacterized protein G01um101418_903 [Parcubacteria group bacterium Gr01-1014_18]|nr:MAG: Uncharacterized protein Greene041636_882 [Parcubacteria group bacterium Greene0416_36]TSC79739.1 MAG: Uncharacterized protein G01um101418_903 [Parcubacteria group bacterium Gr01-1014_18]TSC97925.1 MAG: Uncharacterized protein Greene101420_960 [Parcubacteria group bacterium Greene1014_20]TSD06583.1 MAG: Uncharacterized protein Greene07142_792 [Parcubacteria group bacterium Greene0714_2]
MNISLVKFGTTLTSRQLGKEAYLAFRPNLSALSGEEQLFVDFEGVITFSPSWGDEFLTPLMKEYGKRLILQNTDNISVRATLELLEEINKSKFTII